MVSTDFRLPGGLARFEPAIRFGVELVLVIALAGLLARLFWLVLAPAMAVAPSDLRAMPQMIGHSGNAGTLGDVRLVADRTLLAKVNPFGAGTVETAVPDAPETQLNLRLSGLRMSTDGPLGTAIIATPDGIDTMFAVGDEILPGVILARVLSDRVIIERNGEAETLMLGGRGAGLSVIGNGDQASAPGDEGAVTSTEDQLISGRSASVSALLATVSVQPVMRDGSVYAYALSLQGSADAMSRAGLVPGDLLVQVANVPAANLTYDDLAARMAQGRVADLRIERNGIERSVRIEFDE